MNHLLSRKGRDLRITEQMLILSCSRCGRSFTADRASIARQPRYVVYACPHDGAELASVSVGEFFKGGGDLGFHEGSLAIKVGGERIGFADFMREIRGGPPGSMSGTFSGTFSVEIPADDKPTG
jgi:hypothetical protein